ncbi:MAG: hypothetical protein JXA43_02385 [Candidatus Diapherotrites archaeon]|nr:hypothetical protein [Candidatus Diapherotrites archaeon]
MVGKLNVPDYLNAPWLTRDYIENWGWVPTSGDVDLKPVTETPFGELPLKSRDEFKAGDIIIFYDAEEREVDGKIETDRFITVEQCEIDLYKQGKADLLPHGVVVHPPKL